MLVIGYGSPKRAAKGIQGHAQSAGQAGTS
jgi:hypothetical protein